MKIMDRQLLSYQIERVRFSKRVDEIIIATTFERKDDPVAKLAKEEGVILFRGSENNVLDRYYQAATKFGCENIMRLTADCPLIDPDFIDDLAEFYNSGGYDYASNVDPPTLPDGLDAEIFTFEALEDAHSGAILPSHLEHVTEYILQNPESFKIGKWTYEENLSHLRWTVDESVDFEFVKRVFEALYDRNKEFRTKDVLDLLENCPELIEINSHINRNEGYLKSLEEDNEWCRRHGPTNQ